MKVVLSFLLSFSILVFANSFANADIVQKDSPTGERIRIVHKVVDGELMIGFQHIWIDKPDGEPDYYTWLGSKDFYTVEEIESLKTDNWKRLGGTSVKVAGLSVGMVYGGLKLGLLNLSSVGSGFSVNLAPFIETGGYLGLAVLANSVIDSRELEIRRANAPSVYRRFKIVGEALAINEKDLLVDNIDEYVFTTELLLP